MYPKCCYKSIVDFYSFLPFQIKQYEKKMAKPYIHGNDFELRNENQKKKCSHSVECQPFARESWYAKTRAEHSSQNFCPFFIQLAVNNLTGQDQSQTLKFQFSACVALDLLSLGKHTPDCQVAPQNDSMLSAKLRFDLLKKLRIYMGSLYDNSNQIHYL